MKPRLLAITRKLGRKLNVVACAVPSALALGRLKKLRWGQRTLQQAACASHREAATLPAPGRGRRLDHPRFRDRWRAAASLRVKLFPRLRWMRDARSNFPHRPGSWRE